MTDNNSEIRNPKIEPFLLHHYWRSILDSSYRYRMFIIYYYPVRYIVKEDACKYNKMYSFYFKFKLKKVKNSQ